MIPAGMRLYKAKATDANNLHARFGLVCHTAPSHYLCNYVAPATDTMVCYDSHHYCKSRPTLQRLGMVATC